MTIDDLVFIIGKKQIEIEFLAKKVELLKKEITELEEKNQDKDVEEN